MASLDCETPTLDLARDVEALRREMPPAVREAELRMQVRLARQRTETLTWLLYGALGRQTLVILGAVFAAVRP